MEVREFDWDSSRKGASQLSRTKTIRLSTPKTTTGEILVFALTSPLTTPVHSSYSSPPPPLSLSLTHTHTHTHTHTLILILSSFWVRSPWVKSPPPPHVGKTPTPPPMSKTPLPICTGITYLCKLYSWRGFVPRCNCAHAAALHRRGCWRCLWPSGDSLLRCYCGPIHGKQGGLFQIWWCVDYGVPLQTNRNSQNQFKQLAESVQLGSRL